MKMVVIRYPAVLPTFEEVAARSQKFVPFFEKEVPGLIDKTWGMNEETGRMVSVYHFEDGASAEAYFQTPTWTNFRDEVLKNRHEMEFFDVAAVAFKRPLKS